MAPQNNWSYCKNTTEEHHLSKCNKNCLDKIDAICKRDGAKKTEFSNEVCFDLDKYESIVARRQKRNACKTMDFFFGITNGSNKQAALVELRLNYKSINNLTKRELDKKAENSRNIIGHNPVIHNPLIFVFNSNILQQAKYKIKRLYVHKRTVIAYDLRELRTHYF